MEKELRKRLLACKTQHEFDMVVYDVVANCDYLSGWIDINVIFTDNQKAWREKLVSAIKSLIDEGVEGREICLNSDFSKFKIYNVGGFKKFNPKVYHGRGPDDETNTVPPSQKKGNKK